jgi:hypothetical protein
VRNILDCIEDDPSRPGLEKTPERYAKALLFFTQGYKQNLNDILNGAIFDEGHRELVVVRDIDFSSLCEHHLVPFTGKVCNTHSPPHFDPITQIRFILAIFPTEKCSVSLNSQESLKCFLEGFKYRNGSPRRSPTLFKMPLNHLGLP